MLLLLEKGSMEKKTFKDVLSFVKSQKTIILLVIIFVIGIFFVFSVESEEVYEPVMENTEFDFEKYTTELENKLYNLISKMDDVKNVSVMVTLESKIRNVYAYDSDEVYDSDGSKIKTNHIFFSDKSGVKFPVVVTEELPKIKGVAVVCEGAENSIVKIRIIEMISSVLGVPTNRICVTY